MAKSSIAIVHPKLGWGGSEATVFWMIEALQHDYDISLITCGQVNASLVNEYYGTHLDRVSVIQVPVPFFLATTTRFAALRGRFIQRYCQKVAGKFDLMIDAYSPTDFKKKGIQFATDIESLQTIISLSGWKKYWYTNTLLRKLYLAICDWVSPLNISGWKENVTFSNSYWTANVFQQRFGISSQVVYPPVSEDFPDVSYNQKKPEFLIMGRLVPEKKIEMAIQILEAVRQKGHEVNLRIIGGIGDSRYLAKLQPLMVKNKSWIFFEGRLSQEAKKNMIAQAKFGLSCRSNEPFGIAVAEMVKAGSIVFVPEGGGQTEIVQKSELMYQNVEDAATKIDRVLRDENLQKELSSFLSIHSKQFGQQVFKEQIIVIVRNFFNHTS